MLSALNSHYHLVHRYRFFLSIALLYHLWINKIILYTWRWGNFVCNPNLYVQTFCLSCCAMNIHLLHICVWRFAACACCYSNNSLTVIIATLGVEESHMFPCICIYICVCVCMCICVCMNEIRTNEYFSRVCLTYTLINFIFNKWGLVTPRVYFDQHWFR